MMGTHRFNSLTAVVPRPWLAATRPWLVLVIGLLYFAMSVFSLTIFTALRQRSISVGVAATFELLSPFAVPVVVAGLRAVRLPFRFGLALLTLLAATSIAILGGFLAAVQTAGELRTSILVGLALAWIGALSLAALALTNAYVIEVAGKATFFRLRIAGTVSFALAALAASACNPFLVGVVAFAGLGVFVLAVVPEGFACRDDDPPGAVQEPLGEALPSRSIRLLLGLAVAVAVTARPFQLSAHSFLDALVGHASLVLILSVTFEVFLLARMPALLRRRGGQALMLNLTGGAWFLVYAGFGLGAFLGAPWMVLMILPLQGFNAGFGAVVATTLQRCAAGRSGQIQATILTMQGLGTFLGTILVALTHLLQLRLGF